MRTKLLSLSKNTTLLYKSDSFVNGRWLLSNQTKRGLACFVCSVCEVAIDFNVFLYILLLKEKCVKLANAKGLERVIWLIDIEHLKYSTLPPIAILRQIAHLLQYYYPERLHKAYVLFAPFVFRMIWKLISGLLTEVC